MCGMASVNPPEAFRPGWLYRLVRIAVKPFLAVLFRASYSGHEHVPAEGPVLLAANHLSGWDTVFLPAASPRPVQFLAKQSLFTAKGPFGRLGRWFLLNVGAVPVLRQAGRDAQAALEAGSEVLRAGRVFVIFPEGTRSRDGRLYQGKSGAAWMALNTGATVVPVGLTGTDDLKPFAWLGKGHRRVSLRFGPPVELDDLAGKPGAVARREATERIMDAIAALTGQERADGVNATSAESSS